MIGPHQIETLQQIENYIFGRLSQKEIDALWMEFLQSPGWLLYLEIEINLRALAKYGLQLSIISCKNMRLLILIRYQLE